MGDVSIGISTGEAAGECIKCGFLGDIFLFENIFEKVLTIRTSSGKILFVRRSGGMADAQASGACSRKAVWVQVPSPA